MNAIDFQELLRLEKQKWKRNRNNMKREKNPATTTIITTNKNDGDINDDDEYDDNNQLLPQQQEQQEQGRTSRQNQDDKLLESTDDTIRLQSFLLPVCIRSSALFQCVQEQSAQQQKEQIDHDYLINLQQYRVIHHHHHDNPGGHGRRSNVSSLSEVYYIPNFLTPEFTNLLLESLDALAYTDSGGTTSCNTTTTTTTTCASNSDNTTNSTSTLLKKTKKNQQRPLPAQPQPHARWTRLYYSQRNVAVFDLTLPPPPSSSSSCCCMTKEKKMHLLLETLAKALVQIKAFPDPTHPPNHVLINEYDASGGIMPHTDGPMYLDRTATFSIGGGDVLFRFQKMMQRRGESQEQQQVDPDDDNDDDDDDDYDDNDNDNGEVMQIKLHGNGSLIVFAHDAYTHHYHSIRDRVHDGMEYANENCVNANVGERIQRGRRISLTFRHLKK